MNGSALISKQTIWGKAMPFICFLGWLITLLAVFTETHAQGNLLVTPRRVVFGAKKKMQELNLANTGKDTARYVISLIDVRMKEDGSFEQITEADSGQHFAGQQLRIFPRSVVLAPNESQVVKVQVINTAPTSTLERCLQRKVPARLQMALLRLQYA
jgi:P pilus assembly chaperone PapD